MSISSAEVSPLQSPALSPSLSRRLSSRRGSISASDPWGEHSILNMNPSRSSSSRLTIVRVPQPDEPQDSRNHRRHGSNTSIGSTSSSKGESGRLSFAFSSFTPINRNRDAGRPGSPGSSPRMRPSSPSALAAGMPGRPGMPLPQHTKLSPEKLVELARSSCNPRPVGPHCPMPGQSVPVSFTALPDDIYLPFIDRPAEVTSLFSIPPSSKLLALLSQTFPPEGRTSADASTDTPSVDSDAHAWTFAQLECWLKRVTREDVDDAAWVRKARHCILPRSELIWERIKGALGIPPEIDTDDSIEDPLAVYLGLSGPPSLPVGRTGLASHMLDADVFEPDSPVASIQGGSAHATNAPPSPVPSELELSIEPVLATAPPPPSTVDPTTGANMTSLHELREEDEEEKEEEGDVSSGGSTHSTSNLDTAIQGLRISTPSYSPSIGPNGSIIVARASPSPRRMSESESMYDALSERGPGHPLFPSSFAHLSNTPTLRTSNSRSNSMSYPPASAFGLNRSGSLGSRLHSAPNPRPEWARGWDPTKHEDAITTSSISVAGAAE